jgi:zinc/manganese transport system permease protein
MFWPLIACVLLPWLFVYLGLHVLRRELIFVDIAMAQIASFGICAALLLRLAPEGATAFAVAFGFTLLAATLFSITGDRRIPQEAIVAATYLLAAGAMMLLLHRASGGDEEIRKMLLGNISQVGPMEVWKCFGILVAVGVLHFVFRRSFLLVSFDRERALKKGLRIRWWDFLFYALFGLAVTSFVPVAGILLTFGYLLIPALCAIILSGTIGKRLIIGWLIALIGGVVGLFFSFWWDLPSGAAIVCTFGGLLILVSVGTLFRRRPDTLA